MPWKDKDKKKTYEDRYRSLPGTKARMQEYQRHHHLKKVLGITLDDWRKIIDSQAGLCGICTVPMKPGRGTHIDHCHLTGVIRLALCSKCNQAIGLLGEDPFNVHSALTYLEAHS